MLPDEYKVCFHLGCWIVIIEPGAVILTWLVQEASLGWQRWWEPPSLSDMRFQYSVILQYIKCDTGETNLGVECKLLMAVKPWGAYLASLNLFKPGPIVHSSHNRQNLDCVTSLLKDLYRHPIAVIISSPYHHLCYLTQSSPGLLSCLVSYPIPFWPPFSSLNKSSSFMPQGLCISCCSLYLESPFLYNCSSVSLNRIILFCFLYSV